MRRLSVVLLVVVVGVVALGFSRGWFSVETAEKPTGDKVDLTLTVDKGKVQEDLKAAEQNTRELAQSASKSISESVGRKSDMHSIDGTVESVNVEQGQLTIKSEDKQVTLKVNDADTKVELNDVKQGDAVSATYEEVKDEKIAKTVVLKDRNESRQ